jgi:hypothetical protein
MNKHYLVEEIHQIFNKTLYISYLFHLQNLSFEENSTQNFVHK